MGHDASKALYLGELLLGGASDGLHGGEGPAERLGRPWPRDVGDAQGVHQPVEVVALGALQGGHQVFGALFAKALQLLQLAYLEGVQVRRGVDQPALEKLLQNGGAQAVDVHGVAAEQKCHEAARQLLAGHWGLVTAGGRLALRPGGRARRRRGSTAGSW